MEPWAKKMGRVNYLKDCEEWEAAHKGFHGNFSLIW
jgi:hypothetical protein